MTLVVSLSLLGLGLMTTAASYLDSTETGEALRAAGVQVATRSDRTDAPSPIATAANKSEAPRVKVLSITPSNERPEVKGFGVASARYRQTLVSELSGKLTFLSTDFEPGQRVRKGELLAELEDTRYRSAVATAREQVAQAQLTWQQEKHKGELARKNWHSSYPDTKPPTSLVYREPQLNMERSRVEAAKAALKLAENNLGKTRIRAPFDATVISRSATPSAFIAAGATLGVIYSNDRLELSVPLSASQWSILTGKTAMPDYRSLKAEVADRSGIRLKAYIDGEDAVLDERTRQRSLRLHIKLPSKRVSSIKPGSFLSITIRANVMHNVYLVPADSISSDGYLWSVTRNSLLARHRVKPIFIKGRYAAIPANELGDGEGRNIVTNPLSSFLPGQRVTPIQAERSKHAVAVSALKDGGAK